MTIQSGLFASAVVCVLLSCGVRLYAEPVPLSESEMTELADAVVIVEVVRVTRTALTSHQATPIFIACMCVREVRKGPLRVGHAIPWETAQYEVAPGESGGGLLYPGDRMLLFLQRHASGKYNTWRDDCTRWISRPPVEKRCLPEKAGDSICTHAVNESAFSVVHDRVTLQNTR